MTNWTLELLDEQPEEFTATSDGGYVQRTEIHEVCYHSLDGFQTFTGYECFSRKLTKSEYDKLTNLIN